MSRKLICIITLLLTSRVSAGNDQFNDGVREAQLAGKQLQMKSINQAKAFNGKSVFDHYTNQPTQTQYYDGVKQRDTSKMQQDTSLAKSSEQGKTVENSITQHPSFVVKPTDPDIARSVLLQSQAYNILHGITNQYIDCKPKEVCQIQYENKYCEEAPPAINRSCKQKLIVDVITHEKVTHYPLNAFLSVKEHKYAGVVINTVNGRIDFLGPHDASFRLDGRLPANIDCRTLQGSIKTRQGNAQLDHINFPSCGNGLSLDYHISSGHQLNLGIDIASKVVTYELKDRWIDECDHFYKNTHCKLIKETCDVPQSTQVINGIPVTRDCWQKSFQYLCHGENGEGNCQPLRDAQCEQVGSECKEKQNDECIQFKQDYRCATKTCSQTGDVSCGNGKDYCLNGDCTDKSYQSSQDFGRGVSALSSVFDAGKQLDQSSWTIFTGHKSECSEKPIGYSNCCTESGWGQDVGLDHCPEGAKQLHKDRENKLAIKVGRYCSGPEPFPCLVHSQVFCVFGSKLAKIIQEQGRNGQLHIDFGDAEDPNCKGITPEQLQTIDLSRIDFSDFINDLSNTVKQPDLKQIQDRIRQHVEAGN